MKFKTKSQVWSCGGGTQSCAIAVLILQGKLPRPDISVIADTGYETRTTWEYLDGAMNPALEKIGVEVIRIQSELWSSPWALRDMTLIPSYSTINAGIPTKLSNFCTGGWKTEAIDSWMSKVIGIQRRNVIKWIGFSRDEQRRIVKMQQGKEYANGLIRFPLLEAGLTRRECIKLVEDYGWPTPPRSACYMCPNHSDHEWRLIKSERPDEFQKAVEIERKIQAVDPDAWLHRSCVPLDQVDFSQPEDLFSRACDSGVCFV